MVVRIISGTVAILVLVALMICPYTEVLAVAAAILSAIAVWELLRNTGKVRNLVQVIGGMLVSASGVLLMYYIQKLYVEKLSRIDSELQQVTMLLPLLFMVYALFTGVVWLFIRKKVSFNDACYGYLMTLYPTIGFGAMMMLREIKNQGIWLLILLLMIAFVSDTGAYFVGTFLGKHKMAPKISPKKTWEGFFGGWIISVLCAVGLFVLRANMVSMEGLFLTLRLYLPVVAILAPLSVVGDLFASAIKRKCGIKDFGSIMPGHGGVMDRFDSVLFIAPLLYLITVNTANIGAFVASLK